MKANNNGWTDERRKRQAELIHHWKPWKHSTGATTPEGKERSKMNARRMTITGLYRRCCQLCFFRKQWENNGRSMPEHLQARFIAFKIENDDWMDNAPMK